MAYSDSSSLWVLAWKRLLRNRGATIGLVLLVLLIVLAIGAPIFAPMDPTVQVLEYAIKPPFFRGNVLLRTNPVHPDRPSIIAIESYQIRGDSVEYTDLLGRTFRIHRRELWGDSPSTWHAEPLYLLGTDHFGRDVFSRLLYGARVALLVGLIAETLAIVIGVAIGALAGYFRGWVDDVLMWLTNVVWSFPTVLLVIALSVILGQGLWQTFVAIGLSSWVDIARIVRGQFLALRSVEFVQAARALGYGAGRIILRHLLPNTIGPIVVVGTAGFATAIILEASLSFLGLGIQPPTPSWGRMIQDGRGYLYVGEGLGLVLYPSIAIAVAVYAINLFGDGLRDALDPRTLQRGNS
ncbi:MAG: ABC transporter permease [Bacteroidota bacterium]|nr:ABC transporter permease [Candidatus Kapabacteria bacterium]MCS7302806.1 ABC transporter permease [Candidatus Kapabacteria bacterium]MCX7937042.1 ABC transporter permease [Chlorobiota bacterium]MDW8075513.1 ABC transporter permease [Bacteroidota bacterium]